MPHRPPFLMFPCRELLYPANPATSADAWGSTTHDARKPGAESSGGMICVAPLSPRQNAHPEEPGWPHCENAMRPPRGMEPRLVTFHLGAARRLFSSTSSPTWMAAPRSRARRIRRAQLRDSAETSPRAMASGVAVRTGRFEFRPYALYFSLRGLTRRSSPRSTDVAPAWIATAHPAASISP